MGHVIAVECSLPGFGKFKPSHHAFETRVFGGSADQSFRIDARGKLWRRSGITSEGERFDFSGVIDLDFRLSDGRLAAWQLHLQRGQLQSASGPSFQEKPNERR